MEMKYTPNEQKFKQMFLDKLISYRKDKNYTDDTFDEFRKKGICGTDVSAILGENIYKTKIDVFNKKCLDYTKPNFIPAKYAKIGKELEDEIIKDLELKKLRPPHRRNLKGNCQIKVIHPYKEYFRGNVDAIYRSRKLGVTHYDLVEAKSTSYNNINKWGKDFSEIPKSYMMQIMHYAYIIKNCFKCCNYKSLDIHVPVWFLEHEKNTENYEIVEKRIYSILWDELADVYLPQYEENVIPVLEEFWHKNIVPERMPELFDDSEIIKESDIEIVNQLHELEKSIKSLSKKRDTIKNNLKNNYSAQNILSNADNSLIFSNKMYKKYVLDTKKLKLENPEIYNMYVSEKKYSRFLLTSEVQK